jgi:nitrate/nitrite transporter NarK
MLTTEQICVQAVASLTNFLPTLVRNFGFSTIHTLLLTAPPYIVTAGICVLNTWNSDRTGNRSLHIVVPTLGAVTGIVITLATTNIGARYFALFLMLPGTYACFQVSNAWMSSIAARPRKKRGIALALNNSFGNTALTWTPYLYPQSDGPRYVMAWSVNLALSAVLLIATIVLSFCLKRENRKADAAAVQVSGVQSQDVVNEKVDGHHQIEESEIGNETVGRRLGGRNAGATARFQT